MKTKQGASNRRNLLLKADMLAQAQKAARRIKPWIRRTPCEFAPELSKISGVRVYLKLENWQASRSFKLRGAANKILGLSSRQRQQGIILASTGNHAAACAHMASKLGIQAVCILPESVSEAKRHSMASSGMTCIYLGDDCIQSELAALEMAQQSRRILVPPYNDQAVIAGQGTVALEIAEDLPQVDAVMVPVGGGGLISGVAGVMKAWHPAVEIVGCQPENSAVMAESVKAGHILSIVSMPTLSDGTAGGIEPDAITFHYCQQWVDHWICITETEIAQAIQFLIRHHQILVEGAAALPVAALLKRPKEYRDSVIVLILSGARISIKTLKITLKGETSHDTGLYA